MSSALLVATQPSGSKQVSGITPVLRERRVTKFSEVADASGVASFEIPPIQVASSGRMVIQLESVKIFADSANLLTFVMYEGDVLPQNFIAGTDRGNLNEWVEDPPLETPEKITGRWSGAVQGDPCHARVQYSIIEYVPIRV